MYHKIQFPRWKGMTVGDLRSLLSDFDDAVQVMMQIESGGSAVGRSVIEMQEGEAGDNRALVLRDHHTDWEAGMEV